MVCPPIYCQFLPVVQGGRQNGPSAVVAVPLGKRSPELVGSTRSRCKVLASSGRPNRLECPGRKVGCPTTAAMIRSAAQKEGSSYVLRPIGRRRKQHCARGSACARSAIAVWLRTAAAVLPILICGCAVLGHRGPVPKDVATCRELTQQGVAAMELGHWAEAEQLLQSAVEASPVDSATRRYLAEVLWHRGATDAAIVQMEAAVRLDDRDASLVVRSGEMLLGTGAAEKALERANEAIALNPKLASAWALRGRVFWRMNETDRALADLQRSLQFAPDSRDVLMDVAAIYRQRGQHDRCLTTLHHLLDTYPPGQATQLAYWMEGLALSDLGRPQQAVESLELAKGQGPANADVLYYLAQAQLACGRPDAAATAAQQALAVNPEHAPSRQLLTQLAVHTTPEEPIVR